MQKEPLHTNSSGFSVVEVLLAGSIFVLLVTAFVGAYLYGQESTALAGNRARAVFLAEEGLEAVRNIRDAGFLNLTNGTHGVIPSGGQWILNGTSDTTGIFTRTLSIASVDATRKAVTATVTWQQNPQRTGSVSLVTRLTNWLQSAGNWAFPSLLSTLDIAGTDDGLKVAQSGNFAYVVRGSGSPNFLIVDVSTPTAPTLAGSLTLSGSPTNIVVSSAFAYVSNTSDSQELQIINIASPSSPSVAGTYNASGSADANGVWISGTSAYLARSVGADKEFVIVDVATPATPTLIGSLDLNNTAYEVATVGTRAYVASASNNQELQIISIAIPTTPTLAGSLNLSGNTNALTLAAFSTTVIIGQGNTLYAVDVASASSPSVLSSVGTGGTVNDISLGIGNSQAFLADSSNNSEFQIANISTLTAIGILGTVNISDAEVLSGAVYDPLRDKAYGVGSTDTAEFMVFTAQ